ncbi:hypothetical protein BDV23DRAFT_146266 [Aspergillus alliaceus]|uniref:Uncharacterized protein n=1 Tax=Petromyces alliaceus TaxID=209559 RepID=A0A5N7CLP9_PETAA|nr:hypothetical protein BDV23DRAFT_146266 [Aspergillus alliaceus]
MRGLGMFILFSLPCSFYPFIFLVLSSLCLYQCLYLVQGVSAKQDKETNKLQPKKQKHPPNPLSKHNHNNIDRPPPLNLPPSHPTRSLHDNHTTATSLPRTPPQPNLRTKPSRLQHPNHNHQPNALLPRRLGHHAPNPPRIKQTQARSGPGPDARTIARLPIPARRSTRTRTSSLLRRRKTPTIHRA